MDFLCVSVCNCQSTLDKGCLVFEIFDLLILLNYTCFSRYTSIINLSLDTWIYHQTCGYTCLPIHYLRRSKSFFFFLVKEAILIHAIFLFFWERCFIKNIVRVYKG